MTDPTYIAAQSAGQGDPTVSLGAAILLVGCFVVALSALLEHVTGRSNLVTRALDRWSR